MQDSKGFSNSLHHIEEAAQNAFQNYIVLFESRYVILWYIKYIYKCFDFSEFTIITDIKKAI